jgi:AAA15 family ATPase/GTPase
MIDEIEAGIHFKKLKDFWHTILFVAKNNDVQLFVTTHSGECLQAFKDVLEKDEFKNITSEARTITLFQTKDNHVKARTRNFEAFQEAIDEGYNIRGGE